MEHDFEAWPKIPRTGKGTYIITEKIDGTNAQIYIAPYDSVRAGNCHNKIVAHNDVLCILVGSRKQYITPDQDNYGFAGWVQRNAEELFKLGEGRHYGEWAGLGIQKNKYNLEEKQLFLFNTARWGDHNPNTPKCCKVVPILLEGATVDTIDKAMRALKENGSHIGTNGIPEGIIAYNTATRQYLKTTFKSPNGKWEDKS